jgi:hypothetical protein
MHECYGFEKRASTMKFRRNQRMTCRYTNTHWRDALYNAVREGKGGVAAAALFLSERRGVNIRTESLRKKLNGEELLDVDMAVLLSEFLAERVGTAESSRDWLLCLCAQEGLHVDDVPPPPESGHPDEARALQEKFMQVSAKIGRIAVVTAETVDDNKIEQHEADDLIPQIRAARVLLHRMERNIMRAVQKSS